MKACLHGVCLLIAGITLVLTSPAWSATPNVLLITLDTVRADRVGCYGHKQARTNNLDSLARDGVLFKTAVAPTPLTLPSHCSILTGTYPMVHGVRDNIGYALASGQTTLATILKLHGYSTAAFVGAYVLDARRGLNQGFDTYSSPFQTRTQGEKPFVVNLRTLERRAEEVVAEAIQWMRAQQSKPFFVWIHLFDPHDPYEPPARFRALFRDPYDGEIAYADYALGQVINYLKAQGLYDQMLIVATSDHGESFGEHGEFTHGYFIYDTTLLVPLILKPAAGMAVQQAQIDTPVRTIDIAPTILQFLKVPVPPTVQGTSLLSLILGKHDDRRPPDAYSETYYPNQFGWSALRSLRQGRFKYIDAPKPELYDLQTDRRESRNLFGTNRAIALELKSQLEAIVARSVPEQRARATPASPVDIELLKSLGYLGTSTPLPESVRQQNLPDPKDKLAAFQRISASAQLAAEGKCAQALGPLERLTQEDPSLYLAHFLLGQCHFTSGEYEAAASAFARASRLRPYSVEAVFYKAASDFHLGDMGPSFAGLQLALKIQPGYPYAHFYLGLIYQRREQVEYALREFQECVDSDPEFGEAHYKLGFINGQLGKSAEAIPHFRMVIALDPQNAEAHYNLGVALARLGKGEEAGPEFNIACRLNTKLCQLPHP